jgi:hypothetical protein
MKKSMFVGSLLSWVVAQAVAGGPFGVSLQIGAPLCVGGAGVSVTTPVVGFSIGVPVPAPVYVCPPPPPPPAPVVYVAPPPVYVPPPPPVYVAPPPVVVAPPAWVAPPVVVGPRVWVGAPPPVRWGPVHRHPAPGWGYRHGCR